MRCILVVNNFMVHFVPQPYSSPAIPCPKFNRTIIVEIILRYVSYLNLRYFVSPAHRASNLFRHAHRATNLHIIFLHQFWSSHALKLIKIQMGCCYQIWTSCKNNVLTVWMRPWPSDVFGHPIFQGILHLFDSFPWQLLLGNTIFVTRGLATSW